jgi:hypothetical protein
MSVTKHFGHSKIRESKPGLSGSMIRNAIVSPHFLHRGPLIRSTSIAYPPIRCCSTFVVCRAARTLGSALRKSYVRKVTDVWKVADVCATIIKSFLKMKFAECLPRAGTKSLPEVWSDPVTYGDILMRSKLAISALFVASLFGSTLVASAQNQTGPGASSEGNVSAGATSAKKTQHEKGMTTGSSTRNGANKGGAATPSDQDNVGSGADNMAAPKSGTKY